jgi:hypothetical protein
MSVEYFVAYAASNKSGKECVGRIAVSTGRIISIAQILELEKSIGETMECTGVVITNWRRFEPVD